MATIRSRKTKSGKVRYQAIVRLTGAPPVVETFTQRALAVKWAGRVEDDVRSGRFLPRREAERRTVGDAIDRYELDHLASLAPGEVRTRRARLGWWRKRLGTLSLASLTPAVIGEARDALLRGEGLGGEPASGPTSNRYVASLSAVLDLAAREWQWISENPARRIRRRPEHPGRVRFLTDDERDGLLEACRESTEPRLYPLVLCALASGARQAELLGLRWRDLQLDREPPRALLTRSKNRDRRALFFPDLAGEELRRMVRTPHISGFVFANREGKPTFPRKVWEKALSRAGVQSFTFHDLRHTAASYLAMSGATLPELAGFLGHRSMAMVTRYAHLSDGHSADVAVRMAAKFLGGPRR